MRSPSLRTQCKQAFLVNEVKHEKIPCLCFWLLIELTSQPNNWALTISMNKIGFIIQVNILWNHKLFIWEYTQTFLNIVHRYLHCVIYWFNSFRKKKFYTDSWNKLIIIKSKWTYIFFFGKDTSSILQFKYGALEYL